MFRLVATFSFLCLIAASQMPEDDIFYGRIVGGHDLPIESAPYQVSVQTTAGSHFCGGSIIDEDTIVTAAHCMQRYTASEFKIRLGSSNYQQGGEVVSVRAFKNHEGYNPNTMVNDVAIIKLSTPVQESAKIRFIRLASKTPATGTPALVTGWGTTCYLLCGVSTQLKGVEVDVVQEKACSSNEFKYGSEIQESMVCAYNPNKDACQGDSGGPLVAKSELVGVVSWGRGCARNGYPGVYSDVATLRSWIVENAATL